VEIKISKLEKIDTAFSSESWSNISDLGIGTLFASSFDGEHPDLDWALIEIERPHNEPGNVIYLDPVTRKQPIPIKGIAKTAPTDTSILAITSSGGIQTGWLSGTPSYYKSPYGNSFEEVWTVRFDREMCKSKSKSSVFSD
jgi:hypothetical protein